MPIANCAGSLAAPICRSRYSCLVEVAAHAVGEDRDLGVDVGAGLERALRLAVLADAAVAGAHADDSIGVRAFRCGVSLVEHVLTRETPEQIDAFGFDLLGQPLREVRSAK